MQETNRALPLALNTIVEKLNFKYIGPKLICGYNTYLVDLSDWNLSLTDANPCIWIRQKDLSVQSIPELADSIKDVARNQHWLNNVVLIFVDGAEEDVKNLRHHLPPAMPTYVIFDENQQININKSKSPTAKTLQYLLAQISRSQLSPYEIHKSVVGSRFFGRQHEINQVLKHLNTNYLFIGIRQIGKTSLLKEIQRRMDRSDPPKANQIRRIYLDCSVIQSEMDFWRAITSELDPAELKMLLGRAEKSKRFQKNMFKRFTSLHGEPITYFIDELDRLLTCVKPSSDLFDVLRAASNEGLAHFVMAGFRLSMQAVHNLESPFFDLVTPISLKGLKRSEIYHMVIAPMERLRIQIQNRESVVNRIARETAGFPNYVQFYCKTLLDHLDEEQRSILTEENLKEVYENHAFRGYVLDTFMDNTETLEQALVYALAAEDDVAVNNRSFSQKTMDTILKKRKLSLKFEQLERVCRNLHVAGVFNKVGSDYTFTIPLFVSTLRASYDVEFLFDKTHEDIISENILHR